MANFVNAAIRDPADEAPSPSTSSPDASMESAKKAAKKGVKDWREVERPMPRLEVGPRWCRFCEVNKPDRTHHCRHCGTCVLQFDREFGVSPIQS